MQISFQPENGVAGAASRELKEEQLAIRMAQAG